MSRLIQSRQQHCYWLLSQRWAGLGQNWRMGCVAFRLGLRTLFFMFQTGRECLSLGFCIMPEILMRNTFSDGWIRHRVSLPVRDEAAVWSMQLRCHHLPQGNNGAKKRCCRKRPASNSMRHYFAVIARLTPARKKQVVKRVLTCNILLNQYDRLNMLLMIDNYYCHLPAFAAILNLS